MRFRACVPGPRVPSMKALSSASHVSRLLAAAIVAAVTALAAVPAEAFVIYNRTGHAIQVSVSGPDNTTWSANIPPHGEGACNFADGAGCANPDRGRTTALWAQIFAGLDFSCVVRMQAGGSV